MSLSLLQSSFIPQARRIKHRLGLGVQCLLVGGTVYYMHQVIEVNQGNYSAVPPGLGSRVQPIS